MYNTVCIQFTQFLFYLHHSLIRYSDVFFVFCKMAITSVKSCLTINLLYFFQRNFIILLTALVFHILVHISNNVTHKFYYLLKVPKIQTR